MSILSHPALYILSQRMVGADLARDLSLAALDVRPGQRVLDIGCGPAYYFDRLPPCEYHGFDTDETYIAYARRRFGDRGRFSAEPYAEPHRAALAPFDRVMLMGLLHHLDDATAGDLLALVARSLAPGGRVVALDTVLFETQSGISRFLAKNDRGDFVRHPDGFRALARRHFQHVEDRLYGDTPRVPSSFFLMTLADPV